MTPGTDFDRPRRSPRHLFLTHPWGGSALISLYLSVLSGIVVALQYNPADPFYATSALELVVPYGSFWRGLHYYSSQAFFLLLICHFTAVVWDNTHYYSRMSWLRLSLSLPLAMLLLFTGYILRDDATGEAAGLIGENILRSIPLIGVWLNDLLLAVTTHGVLRVYANHIAGLMVIGGICVWPHLRRYPARWRNHLVVVSCVALLAVLTTAPLEPHHFGMLHIGGPWFFLGLQEILRYMPTFWAGVAYPALFVCLLLFLPHRGTARKWCLLLTGTWLGLYAVLSFVSWTRI